jgi:hypothetical protein
VNLSSDLELEAQLKGLKEVLGCSPLLKRCESWNLRRLASRVNLDFSYAREFDVKALPHAMLKKI